MNVGTSCVRKTTGSKSRSRTWRLEAREGKGIEESSDRRLEVETIVRRSTGK